MGQSQLLNRGFGDDHHSRLASTVGFPASHGAKTEEQKLKALSATYQAIKAHYLF
jgi:hypothetical protein